MGGVVGIVLSTLGARLIAVFVRSVMPGNLDTENSEKIYAILRRLSNEGLMTIMIAHNPELASRAERTVKIRDGLICV